VGKLARAPPGPPPENGSVDARPSQAVSVRSRGTGRARPADPGRRCRRLGRWSRGVPAAPRGGPRRSGPGLRHRAPPGACRREPSRRDPAEVDRHGGVAGHRQRADRAQPRLRHRARDVARRRRWGVGARCAGGASLPRQADRHVPRGARRRPAGGRGRHRALRNRRRRRRRPASDPPGGWIVPRAGSRDGRVRRHAPQRHRLRCRRRGDGAGADGPGTVFPPSSSWSAGTTASTSATTRRGRSSGGPSAASPSTSCPDGRPTSPTCGRIPRRSTASMPTCSSG